MSIPKLTKAELVEAISNKAGITAKEALELIDALMEAIKDGLFDDRVIELRGFGTFQLRTRRGREAARNPSTGETVGNVGPHGVTVFRPGAELKAAAWGLRN